MVVVLVGVLGGAASAATLGVKAEIRRQDRIIRTNPATRQIKHFKVTSVKSAEAAIPKFRALASVVNAAAIAVAGARATTADQRTARHDWVTGARDLARGLGIFTVALHDAAAGHKRAFLVTYGHSVRVIAQGETLIIRADALLGLPSGA